MTHGSAVPRLIVERLMLRQAIAVPGDSMASYALLKLIPTPGTVPGPPLHVALALNVSGSMYEQDGTGQTRLDRVRQAIVEELPLLRPADRISVIAFANGAR